MGAELWRRACALRGAGLRPPRETELGRTAMRLLVEIGMCIFCGSVGFMFAVLLASNRR